MDLSNEAVGDDFLVDLALIASLHAGLFPSHGDRGITIRDLNK